MRKKVRDDYVRPFNQLVVRKCLIFVFLYSHPKGLLMCTTCIHTCVRHTYIHTRDASIYTYMHAHPDTRKQTHTHACTYIHLQIFKMQTSICTYSLTCIHIHTCILTDRHVYIHADMHMFKQTSKCFND